MAFTVEDGTGKNNANSLCDVATADAFWTDRGNTDWSGQQSDKEAALVRASDYVRNQSRYLWVGTKKTYAQVMPWPRTGATEYSGQAIPDNVVPWQVQQAVAYLALAALTTPELQPTLEHGGKVRSESVAGVVSTTYADDAPVSDVIQFVDGLLQPLLRSALRLATPHLALPTVKDGFQDGQFVNPGTTTAPIPDPLTPS